MHGSSAAATQPQDATTAQRLVVPGLVLVAAVQLGTAVWMLVAPRGFHASVGAFGVYNPHYLRDAMAFTAGIGVALALAVRWRSLRPGALTAATAAIAFHAINHWADLGADHPGSSAGVTGALSQTSLAVVCALLLAVVVREPAR